MTRADAKAPLISRWNAGDLRTLWLRRIDAGDDGRVIGFWSRREGDLHLVDQHTFLRQSLTLAEVIRDAGGRPLQPVVIECAGPRGTLMAYVAAVLSGALPLVTPVHLTSRKAGTERAAELCANVGAACIVTDRATTRGPSGEGSHGYPVTVFDPLEIPAATAVPGLLAAAGTPDDPLHLQLTSGSTAAPRATVVTNSNAFYNCSVLSEAVAMTPFEAIVSWLPLYHDMGLVGMALVSLMQGTDVHLLSPFDFVAHPSDWLRLISRTGAVATASPTFGFRVAASRTPDSLLDELDLSTLRIAACGGEPVLADALTAFAKRFARCGLRPGVIRPGYGLAEATLTVTFARQETQPSVIAVSGSPVASGKVSVTECGRIGEDLPLARSGGPQLLVSSGPPVSGTEVAVVDPLTGEPHATEDVSGEIAVRGPGVTPGFWEKGALAVRSGAWLRTGDVGLLHRGELYPVERANNLLIRNGQNYAAVALEATLAAACDMDVDAIMVVDRDILDPASPLIAVLEAQRGADPFKLAGTAAAAGRSLELPLDEVIVTRRGALPRTSSGKKQHAGLRQALRDGSLGVLATRRAGRPNSPARMDFTGEDPVIDIRDPLAPAHVAGMVIEEVTRAAEGRGTAALVCPDAHLHHDLDLDSLALFELAVAVEQRTGMGISQEHLLTVRSVADLIEAAGVTNPSESGLRFLQEKYLEAIPQIDVLVEGQRRRSLSVEGREVVDFASCNYLGLDLHPAVISAIDPLVREWGVHPSWTRAVASPEPYQRLEHRLAALVGAPDAVLFPTITLLHLGVLPALAGRGGALLVDESAHHSIHEAAELSGSRGTEVRLFRHGDLEDLTAKLQATASRSARVVAIDGVYSMSGAVPDLAAMLDAAEAWDATLYIDDAHGFGILGEGPDSRFPLGRRGNGVLRNAGLGLERAVYVAGLSKAYSSLGAFVTCRGPGERRKLMSTSTLVFSGPVPTASLASALAGLDVNESEGDAIRKRLHDLAESFAGGIRGLGLAVSNTNGFPILTVEFGSLDAVTVACRVLWDHGILITPAIFPAMPIDKGGVRFSVTAANTYEDIERALKALAAARDAVGAAAAAPGNPAPRTTSGV